MRRHTLLVWLVFIGWLALSACHRAEGRLEEIPQPTATQIAALIVEEIVEVPANVNPESGRPTLVLPEEQPPDEEDLDCAEIFCLFTWPGWLERPIGLGGTRTIDRSYPYASTGGGEFDLHHGVEFLNPYGTPVFAAQDGEVAFAEFDTKTEFGPFGGFYGRVIILRHRGLLLDDLEVYTLYAHLSEAFVREGDLVSAGDRIGEVGSSGAAFGPHLHFEVRIGMNTYDQTVNPVLWFSPLDDPDHSPMAMLAGVIIDPNGNPIPELPLALEYISNDGIVMAYYYPKTYYASRVNAHPLLGENFVVPDLPPGDYRLAFIYDQLYEVFFTLEPGSLGFINFQLD